MRVRGLGGQARAMKGSRVWEGEEVQGVMLGMVKEEDGKWLLEEGEEVSGMSANLWTKGVREVRIQGIEREEWGLVEDVVRGLYQQYGVRALAGSKGRLISTTGGMHLLGLRGRQQGKWGVTLMMVKDGEAKCQVQGVRGGGACLDGWRWRERG